MAQRIIDGIELATSRAEMGMSSETEGLDTLIENIRIVGMSMADADEQDEEAVDLEHTVMTLERELKMRSRTLMSSKVASGFINEILGVITSFSDRQRAQTITDEFLKGETSLKKAENLLQKATPEKESKAQFLHRIQNALSSSDLDEGEKEKLEQKLKPTRSRKKKKKTYSKAVEDGVVNQLKALGIDDSTTPEAKEQLIAFVDRMVKTKEKDFKAVVHRRDYFLNQPGSGIIIWNPDGIIEFANETATKELSVKKGARLREALLDYIYTTEFPLMDAPENVEDEEPWDDIELSLLARITTLVRDSKNQPIGFVFSAH